MKLLTVDSEVSSLLLSAWLRSRQILRPAQNRSKLSWPEAGVTFLKIIENIPVVKHWESLHITFARCVKNTIILPFPLWLKSGLWIRVGRFLEFHQKSWVCGSPRYNMGNYQIFLILVQKPVRATPLKVHNFKKIQRAKNKNKIKIFMWQMFSLMTIL